MMPEDESDIAGYSTGVVDKSKIIDNSTVPLSAVFSHLTVLTISFSLMCNL